MYLYYGVIVYFFKTYFTEKRRQKKGVHQKGKLYTYTQTQVFFFSHTETSYIESLETRLKKMEALLEKIQPEDKHHEQHKKVKREISPSTDIPNSIEHNKVVRYLGSSSGYYLVRDILSNEGEEIEEIRNPNIGRRGSTILVPDNTGPLKFKKINVMDDDVMFVRDKTLAEHVNQLETDKLDLHPDIAPSFLLTQLIEKYKVKQSAGFVCSQSEHLF